MSDTPQTSSTTATPLDAAALVDDLQQRCQKLRDWHVEAEARLKAAQDELDQQRQQTEAADKANQERAAQLDERHRQADQRDQQLDQRDAQLDERRDELDHQADRLKREQAETQQQRQELQRLRADLDEEWSSLTRVRRAQEALAAALDAERQRMNTDHFKLKLDNEDAPDQAPRQAA